MPQPSSHITRISSSSVGGWECYEEAVRRLRDGQDILMVSIGDHDFQTPIEIVEAAKRALDNGYHHYTGFAGIPELRDAMAKVSQEVTGVRTNRENVIACIGGQSALFGAIQATMDPDDHAIGIGPYYVTYPGTFLSQSANFTMVDALSEDGFQPSRAAIEAAIQPNTKCLLINSPNNPTGVIYSNQTLAMIAELCVQYDLWLISDEVYWSLAEGKHVSPRGFEGMAERTLVINSLSKSHAMTGWRIGWLTGPAELISYLTALNLVSTYGLPDFSSRAAVEALNNKYGLDHIAATYSTRRTLMIDALKNIDGIKIRGSDGGMYVMIDIRSFEPDGEKFAFHLLDTQNLAVMPGESFGPSTAGHLRISLCQPEDRLLEAARRLEQAVKKYPN